MKILTFLVTAIILANCTFSGLAADDQAERKKLQTEVDAAIKTFKKADSSLEPLFKKAAGYAIFPGIGKGGFIIGGAHGEGQVYEGGKLVGYTSISQGTIGAQIGGQVFSQVIFFEDKDAVSKFKEGTFAMSAQVSAVAAQEGASKNAKYVDGVMVFTKAKQGLMAEASIGGQKFSFEPIAKK